MNWNNSNKRRKLESNISNYVDSSVVRSNDYNDSLSSLINLAKSKDPSNNYRKSNQTTEAVESSVLVDEKDEYPFTVTPDDHCETSETAYSHISSILTVIAAQINKSADVLQIYDPYYCEGSVKERLASHGFKNVYNEKEDFYEKLLNNAIPDFDVLVTNPPYSGNHIEKLLSYCVGLKKPFLLLLPNYVYMKDCYKNLIGYNSNQCIYIAPCKRYLYSTPKGRRQKKSSKYTSPFPTFWYCGGLTK
eukprot:gene17655-23242_t